MLNKDNSLWLQPNDDVLRRPSKFLEIRTSVIDGRASHFTRKVTEGTFLGMLGGRILEDGEVASKFSRDVLVSLCIEPPQDVELSKLNHVKQEHVNVRFDTKARAFTTRDVNADEEAVIEYNQDESQLDFLKVNRTTMQH